ncbi:IS110 family transposase [Candidatus Babeliales bacterium]|nr:IS110 family transposase [Candidatus Babeliales bacterium]
MQLFCGIDVSKSSHAVCIKNEKLETIAGISITNNLDGFRKIEKRVPKTAIVGMEATSEYHKPLEHWLKEKGYEVYVFNPRKTKNFAKVNHIVTKTDKVDAAMLAEFMAMGFYKTQKQWKNKYPELRQFTRARFALVNDQSRIKVRVLTRLAIIFPEYDTMFSSNFGKTFTELLLKYTSPDNFAKQTHKQLTAEIVSLSKGILRDKKAKEIIETAKNSIGIKNEAYVEDIRINLKYIKELEKDINHLNRKIREKMQPIEQSITDTKGIDVPLAATIIAEVGDISQFKSRRALFNFTGMVPMIRESGNYKAGNRHMAKYGNKYLRTAIWLCAISCINHNKEFREYFYKKHKVDKLSKMSAVGAVCRKLTYRIHYIMKNEMN